MNEEVIQMLASRRIHTIRELQGLQQQRFDALFRFRHGNALVDLKTVLLQIPLFELKVFFREGDASEWKAIQEKATVSFMPGSVEFQVRISLLRGNPKMKVYAPKYYKSKVATYWLIVNSGDFLICLKRVDAGHNGMQISLPADRLPTVQNSVITAAILSDSMIGVQASHSFSVKNIQ